MTKERFLELLQLYYDHKLSEPELQAFLEAAEDPAFQETFAAFIDQGLESGRFKGAANRPQARKVLSRIKLVGASRKENTLVILYQRRSYLIGAASALLAIALLVFYLVPSKQRAPEPPQTQAAALDPLSIPAGSWKATLTLADGKMIALDNAAVKLSLRQGSAQVSASQDGILSYHQADTSKATGILENTVTTPRGGTYRLQLPDGTRVWLNADSRIIYPTAFNQTSRTVSLTGEAYFEVAANLRQPFIVKTAQSQVVVLGTAFNIRAYPDLPQSSTTLVSGSVVVKAGGQSHPLRPGAQLDISRDGHYQQHLVDTDQMVAWKNGLFDFRSADLGTIMFNLEKWYDIQVRFKDGMEHRHFTGKFYRAEDASTMLHIMEESNMHVCLQGKTLTISK